MDGCIFCKIGKKEIPSDFLYEDDEIFAVTDIHPKAPVHLLVIPKRHIEKVSDMVEGQQGLFGKSIFVAKKLAEEKGVAESGYKLVFNVGPEGGQVVPHVHLHVLGGKQMES